MSNCLLSFVQDLNSFHLRSCNQIKIKETLARKTAIQAVIIKAMYP